MLKNYDWFVSLSSFIIGIFSILLNSFENLLFFIVHLLLFFLSFLFFIYVLQYLKLSLCCLTFPNGLRSYILGIVFAVGLKYFLNSYTWNFGAFLCFLCYFHWSEFFFTAIYNPSNCNINVYMLFHSTEYVIAILSAVVEYWFVKVAFRTHFMDYLFDVYYLKFIGFLICVCGLLFRLVALVTAGPSYNHNVQWKKGLDHCLVTHGVYSLVRHPAYVGWFYWSLGSQILLGNFVCFIAYIVVMLQFFRIRIYYEEEALIRFFGSDYTNYQNSVGTGLPFIKGYKVKP